jgi:two-component system OmpR family sensor kinase/two-component system sensor histidine kinase BaeS
MRDFSTRYGPPRHVQFRLERHGRARFFRRIAVAAFMVLLLAVTGAFALAWIVTTRFGLAGWAAPIPVFVVVLAAAILLTRAVGAMRHLASPLGAVMEAADRVAEGDYTVRVREHGPPPIRALTHSFNTMTERLQHADRQRRDLMADLAHELRTPLSVLQGRIEGLVDGVYVRDDRQLQQLLEETHVLSRLIEDLRTLALSDAGVLELHKEPTDLVSLLRDVVRSFDAVAGGKGVSVRVSEPPAAVTLDVDALRIRAVLTNLLSNAVRHTPACGSVTMSLTDSEAHVTIAVTDTGEGMPAADVARMFDRFHKGPGSRGSGLGLTIARNLVTSHGGGIAASSRVGEGTTVTVTLPRHQD